MSTKILGLFPLSGNGGIASWTKKYVETFPDEEFSIIPVSNAPSPRKGDESILKRSLSGITDLRRIYKDVKLAIESHEPKILHTTTSGSIGSFRDYLIGKLCKSKMIKTILHCRYGSITEDIVSKNIVGVLTRAAMRQFDQIWVLDSRSYNTLQSIPEFTEKVRLTPNSIKVPTNVDLQPKQYKRIGFVGNLVPTKGLYELVDACKRLDVRLDIIGPGPQEVVEKVKSIAGGCIDKTIFIHGRLPNDQAVEFIQQLDIVALPTYYPAEAFPISILEAMSLGKMVISCPRAAIKDMLTDLNGESCGMLVKPKSAKEIGKAIIWLQENPVKADEMCRKAYEKVSRAYDTSIVYEQYRKNYRDVLLKSSLPN